MKEKVRNQKVQIIFTLAGAAGGFLYWKFIGCTSGTCPIQSVWYWSTIWGAASGYLAGDLVDSVVKKRKKGREDSREREI
ncbi:MAG: hypothetical protein EOM73_15840 [Bacteroidia bacterium]|nr:hypothetical protein [Bacteroidia bacterium]